MTTRAMPAAEIEVTPHLVRDLLSRQHPDLADRSLQLLANGWDNHVYRLGADLLVRLPRHAAGANLLRHEQVWLPQLAGRLPLPVPVPVRAGIASPSFPWPWSVVPYLPGDIASRARPADPVGAAHALGDFLGILHRPAAGDYPVNSVRGVPLVRRDETVRTNLAAIDGVVDVASLETLWETALSVDDWDGPPIWLHGDLHPANVLVDDGRISAIIDFGDVTAGDPATDLSIAWMLLPIGAHGAFRYAYRDAGGRIDDCTWLRARAWALALGAVFVARAGDDAVMYGVGRQTLAAVLLDSAQDR